MFTQCRNVCAKGTETFRLLPLKGQAVLGPIASSPWRSNFSFTPLLCGRLIALAAWLARISDCHCQDFTKSDEILDSYALSGVELPDPKTSGRRANFFLDNWVAWPICRSLDNRHARSLNPPICCHTLFRRKTDLGVKLGEKQQFVAVVQLERFQLVANNVTST